MKIILRTYVTYLLTLIGLLTTFTSPVLAYSEKISSRSDSQETIPLNGTGNVQLQLKNKSGTNYPLVNVVVWVTDSVRQKIELQRPVSPSSGDIWSGGSIHWDEVKLDSNGTFNFSFNVKVNSGKAGSTIPINVYAQSAEKDPNEVGDYINVNKLDDVDVIIHVADKTKEAISDALTTSLKTNKSEAKRGDKISYTLQLKNNRATVTDVPLTIMPDKNQTLDGTSLKPAYPISKDGVSYNINNVKLKAYEERIIIFQTKVASSAPLNKSSSLQVKIGTGSDKKTLTAQISVKEKLSATISTVPSTPGLKTKSLQKKSNSVFVATFGNKRAEARPGELVTYELAVKNVYKDDQVALHPWISATARNVDVSNMSHGRLTHVGNDKKGGDIDFKDVEILPDDAFHPFTFKVKMPDLSNGDQFCAQGQVLISYNRSPIVLQLEDCTKISKTAVTPITPPTSKSTTPKKPAIKITDKNFALTGPDGLTMNGDDQKISWTASDVVQKAYPFVKLELCSGKPFQDCMVLLGSTPNDGDNNVNLAPVPRAGKWYLHMIGRNESNELAPTVSAARLVNLHN